MADAKRARSEATSSPPGSADADDRSVRQRIDAATAASSSVSASAPTPGSQANASSASAAASSSSTPPLTRLSLMRLAVVERQLIMQGLDITSLARLASACNQMRGEALHREAGKFIPEPEEGSAAEFMCVIDEDHSAHASALFRAHMPVTLSLKRSLTLGQLQPLVNKAAHFSRITSLQLESDAWLESRMLHFLALPWIQGVKRVILGCPGFSIVPSVWLQIPAVQHAIFALPSLTSIVLGMGPRTRVFKSAVAQASKLTSVVVHANPERAHSIRALSLAPCVGRLQLSPANSDPWGPDPEPFRDLIWCLSPTLHTLSLYGFNLSEDAAPRPVLKAFFRRTPLLRELHVDFMDPAKLLQGMLDAGVNALLELRRVELTDLSPADLAQPLIRRFLHRFPKVDMRLQPLEPHDAQTHLDNYAFQDSFMGWPRVEVTLPHSNRGPPSPHASDDESASDVGSVSDPGSDVESEEADEVADEDEEELSEDEEEHDDGGDEAD